MKIALIVYDDDAYVHYFPMGVAALTAVLEKKYTVDLILQDANHYPDEYITQYLDTHDIDVVGLSFVGGYYQYRKAKQISLAVNRAKKRPFYILGGHGPSPEPEFFMRKMEADAVCIGEGEETIMEIMEALGKPERDLSTIAGLAYRDGNSFKINLRREPIADIDSLPIPAYHRFPMNYYRLLRFPRCAKNDYVIPMLSGRGCPFKCNFCYRMDEGFRPRSNDRILEEIELLKHDYGITYILFGDELLMSSFERTESFCEALIAQNANIKWGASGRLNYARPDLLRLMRKAGCVFLNYGIESFDNNSLKLMNKSLTEEQIQKGIEATLEAGISPGYNMIFGNYGDNLETLRKSVDFLLRYDDGAQLRTIRPVTPYPGSQLYYDALASGKLKDCEDFYEHKHTNSDLLSVNFTSLSDEEFYKALHWANTTLLDNYQARVRKQTEEQLNALYGNRDATFRGFRHL